MNIKIIGVLVGLLLITGCCNEELKKGVIEDITCSNSDCVLEFTNENVSCGLVCQYMQKGAYVELFPSSANCVAKIVIYYSKTNCDDLIRIYNQECKLK